MEPILRNNTNKKKGKEGNGYYRFDDIVMQADWDSQPKKEKKSVKKENPRTSQQPCSVADGKECIQRDDGWSVRALLNFPEIPDAIFVSVASYRDDECAKTVAQLFERAADPERVFVGVVQQNKKAMRNHTALRRGAMKTSLAPHANEDCLFENPVCVAWLARGNLRVTTLDSHEARGPTYARYLCSKLWRGEEIFLQVDSHMEFEPGWDETVLDQFHSLRDPKAVLSNYPPTTEQLESMRAADFRKTIRMHVGPGHDGLPGIGSTVVDLPLDVNANSAVRGNLIGAGLMCFRGKALLDIGGFDPFLSFLFFGEEILLSARFFTHGYNIQSFARNFATHHYYRYEKPKFSKDIPHAGECKLLAMGRVKRILGTCEDKDVHPAYLYRIEEFGLGSERTLQSFWEAIGVAALMKMRKKTNGFFFSSQVSSEENSNNNNATTITTGKSSEI